MKTIKIEKLCGKYLKTPLEFVENHGLYFCKDLDTSLISLSDDPVEDITEDLEFLYKDFVSENDENLTEKSKALKLKLIEILT